MFACYGISIGGLRAAGQQGWDHPAYDVGVQYHAAGVDQTDTAAGACELGISAAVTEKELVVQCGDGSHRYVEWEYCNIGRLSVRHRNDKWFGCDQVGATSRGV